MTFKACLGFGHCVTQGGICYSFVRATICQEFISNKLNDTVTKRNVTDFRNERCEKAYKAKTESRLQGVIHKMVKEGSTEEELTPYVNMAYALEDDSNNKSSSSV